MSGSTSLQRRTLGADMPEGSGNCTAAAGVGACLSSYEI